MKKAFTRVASACLMAFMACWINVATAQDCTGCTDNCVVVNVTEGGFAAEVGWSITDDAGAVVATGGAPTVDLVLCLVDGCYSFDMTDSFGDGWNGAVYTLTDAAGAEISSGDIDTADTGDGASVGSDVLTIGAATGCIIPGCTDATACNFDATANFDDATCEFVSCAGCTDPAGCNFDATATIDDGSCDFSCIGCTDAAACNFDAAHTVEDGSCCFDNCYGLVVGGGTFDGEIGWSVLDGTGDVIASGVAPFDGIVCAPADCYTFDMTDSFGDGWNGATYTFTAPDGVTVLASGDLDTASSGDGASVGSEVVSLEGSCTPGCTDPIACNFNPLADFENGSCEFVTCAGCTDDTAVNYDPSATIDDGSCLDCTSTFAELSMTDTFGDGWNGATYAVFDATTGAVISTGDLDNAQIGDGLNAGSDFFCIEDNACYTLSITPGTFPLEVGYTLSIGGTELLSGGGNDGNINFFIGAPATDCGFEGCTDAGAINFDAFASVDDGSCVFPPANDLCDNNIPVTCGSSTAGTTINSTITGEETLSCSDTDVTSPGVWYRFTGTGDQVTAETCNSAAGDTKIHVFEGDCTTPVCVGANDDACGFLSSFTWPSTLNVDYFILVSEFGTGVGTDFVLDISCIECTDPIDNDDCVDAADIFSGDAVTQSLCCSAAGDATPCLSPFSTNYDTWYVFNSASFDSFELFVTNSETAGNTSVGFTLWEDAGTGCVDMTALICCPLVTGQCGGTSGELGIAIVPNNDYYVQVYTLDPAGCGEFEISVVGNILGCTDDIACNYNPAATEDDATCEYDSCGASPANDLCADAVVVNCGDAVVGSTGGSTATDQQLLIAGCEDAPGAGVWYTHVGTGEFLTLDFCGSTIDGSVNVYESASDCAGPFTCVEFDAGDLDNCGFFDQDDPFVAVPTTAGVNYYLYVTSNGIEGEFSFTASCEPIVEGCTDEGACNYDPAANVDNGTCDFFSCVCPDATGTPIRFDMVDTFGDGWNGAIYTITNGADGSVVATGDLDNASSGDGTSVGTDFICLPGMMGCFTVTVGGGTFDGEIEWTASIEDGTILATGFANTEAPDVITLGGAVCGCIDAGACNFDPAANSDDGSCEFETCAGCTDAAACNFDADATIAVPADCCFDNCVTLQLTDAFGDGWNGATYTIADSDGNVVSTGDIDTAEDGDGASTATIPLCLVDGCYSIVAGGGTFDGEIGWSLIGVLDVNGNTGILAGGDTDPDDTGDTPVLFGVGSGCVVGCNEPIACNYVEVVDVADCNLCDFTSCQGCTYMEAENFDPTASIDNGSCTFPDPGSDCPEDINGDGTVDGGDLISFLGAFGSDC